MDHIVQDTDSSKPNYGVIADHPELLDVNLAQVKSGPPILPPPGAGSDWLHINGVSYSPERDEIVISSHFMNEFYVIDHSTTTKEAKGHTGGNRGKGGDILYRWGMPENYGAPGDQIFYVIHCSYFVPKGYPGEGNIMVFNNGDGRPDGTYSSIDEITPPLDDDGNYLYTSGAYGPSDLAWTYTAANKTDFYSNHLGSTQRLKNGNTFMCEATSSNFILVDPNGNTVWEHTVSGVNEIARARFIEAGYPGLSKLDN